MRRPVKLDVEFGEDDWVRGDIYVSDGVLYGWVSLTLNRRVIFDHAPLGLNNSAIALVRSATRDHVAATAETEDDAIWPLFFCAGDLPNRCGVIKDFSVTHDGGSVILHGFHRCDLDPTARVTVPASAWQNTVLKFGAAVLRRLPPEKRRIKSRRKPTYRKFRRLLKTELRVARAALLLRRAATGG